MPEPLAEVPDAIPWELVSVTVGALVVVISLLWKVREKDRERERAERVAREAKREAEITQDRVQVIAGISTIGEAVLSIQREITARGTAIDAMLKELASVNHRLGVLEEAHANCPGCTVAGRHDHARP